MMKTSAAVLACAVALAACAPKRLPAPRMADAYLAAYRLDSGDKLRVNVFGQQDLSNTFAVDGRGHIAMPLIGDVPAQGLTTQELEASIAGRLRNGYLRDPSVTVQVDTYRPFFVLGEVTTAGQYPYVSGMTGETAVAIAGGFTPRASRSHIYVTRRVNGQIVRGRLSIYDPVLPGDTVHVPERFL